MCFSVVRIQFDRFSKMFATGLHVRHRAPIHCGAAKDQLFIALQLRLIAGSALNAVTGGWGHYDVIPQTATAQTGNILRIRNKCRNTKNNPVQLGWANTRGGWDYLRFDGRKLKTVTREEKTYRKIVGDYNGSQFALASSARQIKPYQLEAKESYQFNGILTLEEVNLMQYCMRSKNVMARIDGTWSPVTIQTNSMAIEEDTISKIFVVSFNVELAQIIRC